jgi:hypothetical protein
LNSVLEMKIELEFGKVDLDGPFGISDHFPIIQMRSKRLVISICYGQLKNSDGSNREESYYMVNM